jgi:ribosomal protein L11 methyltransferase
MNTSLTPETKLFIYYLEGLLPSDNGITSTDFIGNWEEEGFSFLFFRQAASQTVDQLLTLSPNLKLLDVFQMTHEEWQGGKLVPMQIGNFLIQPPWEKIEGEEGVTEIIVDPGVVFGNGLHPTTRDCLEAIEITCAGNKVESMLDLGTGTGILALAAAKRGCKKALAVDFNMLATQTALNNVRGNSLENQILVVNGKAEELTHVATDLLVANIHYDVMKDLVKTEGFLKQKWFILSGLLTSEAEKISSFLASQPVLILKRWNTEGNWHTILGITKE